MNALAQIDTDAAMEAAAAEIGNIVEIDPPTELERHANLHRRAVERYEARAADTLHSGKMSSASFKEQRKALREKFQADLAELKTYEAELKAATLAAIHTAERLAAASRAALKELEAE